MKRRAEALAGQPRTAQRPETARLYAAEWLAFVDWCRAARQATLPASDETLGAYLLATATGVSRGTIGRRRAAIRAMHRQHDLPPPTLDAATRAALRDVASAQPAGPRQATAPTPAHQRELAARCPRDLAGLRDRSLLLLLASERTTAEEALALKREQIRFTHDSAELAIGEGTSSPVLVPRAATACPVQALEDWLQASDTRYGPVFRKVDRWGNIEHVRLGPDGVRRIIARRRGA